MRRYKFDFKDTDDSDYPRHVKFYDKFEQCLDEGEGDIDELVHEVQYFMMSMGYLECQARSVVYLNWKAYGHPDYSSEYLVTFEDDDTSYASVAKWDDEKQEWNTKRKIKAWCDLPPAYERF